MGGTAPSFSELLSRAQGWNAAALEALYHRYAGPVMAAISRRLSADLRRRYDTMDLAQSVFAELLRDLPGF